MENFVIHPELLRLYFFYSGILILKVILMSYYVGLARVFYKAGIVPEDVAAAEFFVGKISIKPDERVERKRRAHLNDLEKIPFFILGSFLYILTEPSIGTATWIFRIYTLSRIWHTFAYTYLKSFYLRIPGFEIAMGLNVYVVLRAISHFY